MYDPEHEKNFTKEDLYDKKRKTELQLEEKTSIERDKFDKPIMRSGFIRFADYASKLKMMDTALFLFGVKLHNQQGQVQFHDADFLNTLQVSS